VHGIEGDAGLVQRARANATLNGITNATFAAANLAVAGGLPLPGNLTHVLLDPPRTGAREMLPAVIASGAGRIVYVSCHPGSLARDLGILVNEHGCTLLAAGAIDMFPHTNHVESVAVLDTPRRNAR
jgi:23S rRNA (uracil1939-C5)-methyltransferase